jgi:hypothetical protein
MPACNGSEQHEWVESECERRVTDSVVTGRGVGPAPEAPDSSGGLGVPEGLAAKRQGECVKTKTGVAAHFGSTLRFGKRRLEGDARARTDWRDASGIGNSLKTCWSGWLRPSPGQGGADSTGERPEAGSWAVPEGAITAVSQSAQVSREGRFPEPAQGHRSKPMRQDQAREDLEDAGLGVPRRLYGAATRAGQRVADKRSGQTDRSSSAGNDCGGHMARQPRSGTSIARQSMKQGARGCQRGSCA